MAEKKMTRDDAAELYRDLAATMKKMKVKPGAAEAAAGDKNFAKQVAQAIKQGMAKDDAQQRTAKKSGNVSASGSKDFHALLDAERADTSLMGSLNAPHGESQFHGARAAVAFVLFFAGFKLLMSGLEYSEWLSPSQAQAAQVAAVKQNLLQTQAMQTGMSKEEIALLKTLDTRRAEIQERTGRLEEKELDLERRSKEFAIKLTELREMTNTLRSKRQETNVHKKHRIEHLANVYGAMAPQEAAKLMGQLDVSIAVDLLGSMPEKRIGQILALMDSEKALTMTKMLSEKGV